MRGHMKKLFCLMVMFFSYSQLSFAEVYWCPPSVNWDELVKNNYIYDSFWKTDDRPLGITDPRFVNVGALFDGVDSIGKCSYHNSDSIGFGLAPISTKIYPVFHEGIAWTWEDETHKWASCMDTTFCPFTN